jgi:sugar/nucleoside kinase (ribokinase family)
MPAGSAPSQEVTDDQLDQYILTRLRSLGVDLSLLPDDDESAPADRKRILEDARRFLRRTPPAIAAFEMDAQLVAPIMYPAAFASRRPGASGGEESP